MPGKASKSSSSSSAKSRSSPAKAATSKSKPASKQPDHATGKGSKPDEATTKAIGASRSAGKPQPSSKTDVTQSRPAGATQQRKPAAAPSAQAKPTKPVVLVTGPRTGAVTGFTLGGGSLGGGTAGLGATSSGGWNPTGSHAAFDARNVPKPSGKVGQSDASRNAVRGRSGHR